MIRIYQYGQVADEDIFARAVPTMNVESIVAQIIADVKENGDEALIRYCQKFDKATLTTLQVSPQEIEESYNKQIASRLLGEFDPLSFRGHDIRAIKKAQKYT